MTDINIAFSRGLLAQIAPEVKAAGKRVFKDAWVWSAGRDHWEFHTLATDTGTGFYWHGRASNAYEARYKGWSAWLERA